MADVLATHIEHAGWSIVRLHVGPGVSRAALLEAARHAAAVVIAGGDGTVHHCLPFLIETRTPMYHAPSGTENLHARHLGSSASPLRLLSALESGQVRDIDCAACNGVPYAIMVSVGFDAAVVRHVAEARSGAVRKLNYIFQGLRVFASGLGPPGRGVSVPLSITVDGTTMIRDRPGMVAVCNNPCYGGQFDPACRAEVADGLLDVVFAPFHSRAGLLAWGAAMRCRVHTKRGTLFYATGRDIIIESSHADAPWQVDGEWPTTHRTGAIVSNRMRLHINVLPRALRVLTPPGTP
jgi:diacylglycerol kinase family enzyme